MLTPEDLERRRGYITATDVPAILGKYPEGWRNAADVYNEKVFGLDKPRDKKASAAIDAGHRLEPLVIAWASEQIGPVSFPGLVVSSGGLNAATLDAVTEDGCPVEAKTAGIVAYLDMREWGDAGTDEIPEYYLWQVHSQILVTESEVGYLPAMIGGRGLLMFEVVRSEPICDYIATVSEKFWRDHVKSATPPPDVLPSTDTLKYLRRRPKSVVAVSDDLVLRWQESKAAAKEANDYRDECQRELLAAIGDAEAAEWSGGQVTYLQQTRKAYHVDESVYRVIREKKGK